MRLFALAAIALLCTSLASAADDTSIARFRIEIDPKLTQVSIVPKDGGAPLDPAAFAKASRGSVKTLVLLNYTRYGLLCVAALANELGATAIYVDPMTSTPKDIPSSKDKVAAACEVPPDMRRPPLKNGQFYVTGANGAYAIEGQVEMSPQRLAEHLRKLDAKAIVVIVRPTMGALECFGAIAEAAGARLMRLSVAGKPEKLKLDREPSMVDDCAR